jgi:hypothetical protein
MGPTGLDEYVRRAKLVLGELRKGEGASLSLDFSARRYLIERGVT